MSDQKIEQIVKEYADLAKENKNVDAAALMINALQQQDQNRLNSKWKHWAYLVSLVLPPVGFLFAIYYFTKEENDAKSAAVICIVLTVISLVLSILFFKAVLDSSGVNLEQIQQIKPGQIYEIAQ